MKSEADILFEAMDSGEWAVTRNLPASYLTDEANEMFKWSVHRLVAPFCGRDGVRCWNGPQPSVALDKAKQALASK